MSGIDATHDPALESWVASANAPGTDFPLQNLPFGRFHRRGTREPWRVGIAIGDAVLDLRLARDAIDWGDVIEALLAPLAEGDLNAFMALGAPARKALRNAMSRALRAGNEHEGALAACLVAQADCELGVPCRIGDCTDFYAGIHHATTVGKLFRPDQPLMPNYKWVPIGYHGRASSIVASGTAFKRPSGQTKAPDAERPSFGPSKRLDHELELALFVGAPNALGEPIPIERAHEHLFGIALFNDWSARDLQAWEYQPLGPFLAKNFASTVSPWIVTMEALAPFRSPFVRPAGDPDPLDYLDSTANREHGAIDIRLEVQLLTAAMRAGCLPAQRLSRSSFLDAYWTADQLIAHHTVGGCKLQPGDLLGTGTLSGPRADQAGSLLELTEGGKKPIALANGESRTFLDDGDTVILRGWCERDGARRIGFGECVGTVLASSPAERRHDTAR